MSRVVQFMRDLVDKGMSWEDAATFAERFEEGLDPALNAAAISPALAKKRARDAERMRLKREEEEARKRDVAATSPATVASDVVSDGRGAKDAPAPVHTRGENNPSRLVDKPNLTTLNASDAGEPDLDWPTDAKPSRAYLDRLEAALRATAGEALDPTATKLFSLAPILALGRNGAGPPCDVQADVIPTIRARSARAPPRSVRSWDFYTDAIREARDRRLIGAPEARPIHQGPRNDRPASTAKLDAKQANMERAVRGAEIALARRAF